MFQINYYSYKFYSFLLLILGFFSIFQEVDTENNIFFLTILIFSIFQNNFKYKFKSIYSGLIAIFSIYIQFILSDYTISKEFFLNLLLILLFLKFSELNLKENYYFFNYTAVFLGISSLIYGQDLISSIISFLMIIISIVQLYLLNQQKVISLNIRYILKYLLLSFSIIPIIAIIYFLFPRTEINIKIFETQKNQLGIPEKISLGSFQDISESEEKVFIYNNNSENKNEELYFRVKVFDVIDKRKDWINLSYQNLLSKFPKSVKLKENYSSNKKSSQIILFAHDKKWLPKLKDYSFANKQIQNNIFNDTAEYNNKVSKKLSLEIFPHKKEIKYNDDILNFYTVLPNTISPKLINWAKKTYESSEDEKDYLNKILNRFKTENYFYSLSPDPISNDYSKFFFETKTGYCEYYAGVFTILSRIVNIPSRIVSGYYGGSFNELGKFYTFRQQDAHSWVEVYLNNKWIKYDPTLSIPNENIINTNNLNLSNNRLIETNEDAQENFYQRINLKLYFDYANYVWTNKFISYDGKEREKFINENLLSEKIIYKLFNILILISLFIFIYKFFEIVLKRKIIFNLFFSKLIKKNKNFNVSMTHQEMFNQLSSKDKKNFKEIFKTYEIVKFSNKDQLSLKKFFNINFVILKYKFFNVF